MVIGKIFAIEKVPSTIDYFNFWTRSDVVLRPFDVVKVEHLRGSTTYGVVEEISHLTDATSFLTEFISSDFGSVDARQNTVRVGMNCVKAKVVGNTANILIPVHSGSRVSLADKDEVADALGLKDVRNPLVCGYIDMYEASDRIRLPVEINSDFLIGPEGAHLNISGISGLASKTSYAMFLLKAIQEQAADDIAILAFNVKGKDLLAIDEINTFDDDPELGEETEDLYRELGLEPKPFKNVKYYYPPSDERVKNSYVDESLFKRQRRERKAFEYKFDYEHDRDNLDLLFADADDSTQTIDSILNFIVNGYGLFNNVREWGSFLDKVKVMCESGGQSGKEISVLSWRKFYRLVNKSVGGNKLFGFVNRSDDEVRLADVINNLESKHVYVIDIAKLRADMQAFVFGCVVRALIDFQMGDKAEGAPSKVIIFIDELNKYASTETRQQSPILRHIIDIAERGRSLGLILFGAEQFKSSVHSRVTGNCSTFAYGRTNSIELSRKDYRYIPTVYQNMLTRLKQGEYIVQNPTFNSLLSLKFPMPIYRQFK